MEKLLTTPDHQTDHLSRYELVRNCKYLGVQGFNNPEMEAAILKSHTHTHTTEGPQSSTTWRCQKINKLKNKIHASFLFNNL